MFPTSLKDARKELWGENVYVYGIDRLEYMTEAVGDDMKNAEFEPFCPKEVCISMKQGDGAAAVPVVREGEYVVWGQLIGKNVSDLSVPVYASVSGTVSSIWEERQSIYETVSHIVIRSDQADQNRLPKALAKALNPLGGIKAMGIIGMLGKHRPFVLSALYIGAVKTLCLAAFDREPLVYSDYRLLIECPSKVLFGAKVMAEIFHFGELRIFVAHDEVRYILEKTIHAYRHALHPLKQIHFYKVPENMYKKNCTPLEKIDHGLWCSAVELSAVYDGYYDGRPMTGRGITVSGLVKKKKNLWVPNGTYVRDLLEYCGGVSGEKDYVTAELLAQKALCVVEGGPLGGHCVDVDRACVSLRTESFLVFKPEHPGEDDCLLCRDCCSVCPAGLKPLHIERAFKASPELCTLLDVDQCVECGWCSYVCPSHRHLKERVAAAKKHPVRYETRNDGVNAADSGSYIELDISEAMELEPLVPVSQSGPYVYSGKSTRSITDKMLLMAVFMCVVYILALGPYVLWRAGALAALLVAVDFGYRIFFGTPGEVSWKKAVIYGAITAMALSFIPSFRWQLASVVISYVAGRTFKANSLLAGITISLCAYSFVSPASGGESLWIALGWMCAWLYMIYEMLVLPWATVFFLLVFQWFCVVFGGELLWTPMAFMGAVWFMNDYKNGGKDTPMHRTLAVFAGALSGLLSIIFPAGAGICLGLLIVNIIACNLMADTI